VGDGAMQMNGLAELITVKRYMAEWDDPRLVVCGLHNNDLNQVTWEMRAMAGSPMFLEAQKLPDVDYARWAEGLGFGTRTVTTADAVPDAWDWAIAADRPVQVDVSCAPVFPPIPPHSTLEQMKEAATSLAKGDPQRWDIIKHGTKTKAQEFMPKRSETGRP